MSCIDRIQTCVVYRHLMESFLREGVGGIATNNLGDSHFFEDTDPPIKIKSYLSSTNVSPSPMCLLHDPYLSVLCCSGK